MPICIPKREIWTRQPNYPAVVNKVFDTRFVLLPSVAQPSLECVTGKLCSGFKYAGVCSGGVSQDFATTGTRYSDYVVMKNCGFGAGDFAVGVVGTFVSTTSVGTALSNDSSQEVGSNQWRLQPNYNGTAIMAGSFSFLTYGGAMVAVGVNSVLTGGLQSFLGVRKGTTLELWLDGKLIATNTGAVQDVSGAETQSIGFGWGIGTTYVAGGHRVLGYGIAGTIQSPLAASLSKNPWQVFAP